MRMTEPLHTQLDQLSRQIDVAYYEISYAPPWEDTDQDFGDAGALLLSHFAAAGGALAECTGQLGKVIEFQHTPDASDRANTRLRDGRVVICAPKTTKWRHIILLAHEVTHGLHMMQPAYDRSPTLWREVVAFVGELLFADHLVETGTLFAEGRTWLEAAYYNGLYLGPRNSDLQLMLGQASELNPDALYPIARCCALELRQGLTLADLPDLLKQDPMTLEAVHGHAKRYLDRWMARIFNHADAARPDQTLGREILRRLCTGGPDVSVAEAAAELLGKDNAGYLAALGDQSSIAPIAAGEVFAWRRVFAELADCLAAYSRSSYHRHLKFHSFFRREVLPPLILRQCYLSPGQGRAVPAIFSWAFLSTPVADDVVGCGRALDLHEWRAGSRLFVNDFYSEKDHTRALLRHMHTMPLFKNSDRILAIVRNADGSARRVRNISLARV